MKQLLARPQMLADAKKQSQGRHLALEILLFCAVFFVSQSVISIPVALATVVWLFTSEDVMNALTSSLETGNMAAYMEQIEDLASNMPDFLLLVQLFSTALTTVLVILFCRFIEKRTPSTMGLTRHGLLREYGIGTLIGIALIAACVGICALSGSIRLKAQSFPIVIWILYLLGFLIQGMSEEVMCRGYMMVSVSRRYSLVLAVLTNSVAFGLLHIFNPGFGPLPLLNIVLFGILESVYVLKRGDLWGACAIHSIWNFMQGNVFGISVSGMGISASPLVAAADPSTAWLNGGAFGLEGGVAVTAVLAVAILLMLFLLPNKNVAKEAPSDTNTIDLPPAVI
ncbi:MAG: CPBP family intramembrane metalloprotease [Ruminococcaceae bacterium]|nr:CPBP family intramembrane metalloprotease [Oscillospiraceae bacterium]